MTNIYSSHRVSKVVQGRHIHYLLDFTLHRHILWSMASSSFHGRGRPQVPLRAVFQARAGTWIEPQTFCKPAEWLSHMKNSTLQARFRTDICDPNHSATEDPHLHKPRGPDRKQTFVCSGGFPFHSNQTT